MCFLSAFVHGRAWHRSDCVRYFCILSLYLAGSHLARRMGMGSRDENGFAGLAFRGCASTYPSNMECSLFGCLNLYSQFHSRDLEGLPTLQVDGSGTCTLACIAD